MSGHENKVYLVILLLVYVLVVTLVGVRFRKSKSNEDYFLASRSLPAWLLAITFIASWWGGGSAIDLVDIAHRTGLSSFLIYGVPVLLSTALMYIFAGAIRRISKLSQSQIIEKRYDYRSAFMLSVFIIIFMIIAAAVQVIVIGKFFQSFLGMSYEFGAISGALFVLVYSMFGGFKAVVVTDLLQFVFFLLASTFLFIISYNGAGGFDGLNVFVEKNNMEDYTSVLSGLSDNFAYIITFGTSWMVQANVWQRISASRNVKDAKNMMLISFVIFIPLYLMVSYTGMFSSLIYNKLPEGGIVSALLLGLDNQFISGVIFIGLCSAIMSSMDSMFNTGALTMTVDIYKRHIAPSKSSNTYVLVGRLSTILVALISIFIAIKIQSVLTISWIGADFIATGAFVPIVMGFIWKRATAIASLSTMIFGIIFSLYNLFVALGVNLPVMWEIASAQQAIIGISSSFVVYVVVSYCSKADYNKSESFMKEVWGK